MRHYLVIPCLVVSGLLTVFTVSALGLQDPKMHNSENVGTKYGTWGTGWDCYTCHVTRTTPTENAKLVREIVVTPTGLRPVVFRQMTALLDSTNGVFGNDERTYNVNNSTNICEVCHHQTIYHQYSASKLSSLTHPEHKSRNRECTKCHAHSKGFLPPPPGDCSTCHGNPPTSPSQLITNALGPNPPADAGAHQKHRTDEGMGCATCHNGYGHGLLGNDVIEVGFRIDRSNWPNFTGTVTNGTITGTNNGAFANNFAVAAGNPDTTLLRSSEWGASCSIYCHGDNWNIPSGYNRSGPVSWTNGPLGDCSNATCHGTTPQYPPTPSIASGAHSRHVGTNQLACSTCHDNYVSPHMVNGKVKWNLTSQGGGATYKGFNAYSTDYLATTGTYGTCSTIYCHSNVQNSAGTGQATTYQDVTWGGAVLTCGGCHASPMTSGTHTRHTTGYSDRFACSDCHSNAGRDNEVKHADRNIDVAFSATYGGSYSQVVNQPGDGYGTCSTTYCHSDGKGAFQTPAWGGAALSCTGCHNADLTSGSPMSSGKHTAHVNNTGSLGSDYGCIECHANTVSSNSAIGNSANHVNKLANYSGARAGSGSSYVSATGVCSAAYCHSDGKGSQKEMTATNWGSAATLDCLGCHGTDSAPAFTSVAGEPNYANAGIGNLRANSHQRHMGGVGASTCVYCHNQTMTSGGSLVAGSTTHTNRSRDVQAGGGRSFTYDQGTRTCSNISCHGGPSPVQWGQSMPADCTGCHGNNANSAIPQTSGKHKAHMNNYTTLGSNYRCVTCHALTINSDDRTIADPAFHGNGFKNFTGLNAGGRSSYTTATGVCSATYCHSDGKGQQNVPFTVDNGWKSTATLDCRGCHGNDTAPAFSSSAGEPNYASSGAGLLRANNHQNHADTGVASCVSCHADTIGATGAILANVSTHTNHRIDVKEGNGKSFVWSAAGKTCSDISCHGGKGSFTQTWGNGLTANCLGCHGNNTASGTPIALGSHAAHINNAGVIGTNYNCTECHAKTINPDERSFANSANHGNGFKDYSGARGGGPASYSSITGVCSASYCHTDGKGSQKDMTAAIWTSTATLDCTGCHGSDSAPAFTSAAGEPNYANTGGGTPGANNHQRHMGGYGNTACVYCHNQTMTSGGTIIAASTSHTNRTIDVAAGGGRSFTYDQGTKTCSTISCHGAGAAPAQWGSSMPTDCTGCHGGNATSANPQTTGKHAAHMNNPAVLGTDYACVNCHALTVSSDRTIADPAFHGNGFKNFTGLNAGGRSSYTTATGVCSATYCHTDGKGTQKDMTAANWKSAATLDCKGCHGSDAAPDFASAAGEPNYASTGSGTARANSHRNHVDTGAASCVNCHGGTTTTGTSITGNHTNRVIDLIPGNGKSFGYEAGTKTCSTISCHGSGSVPRTWGASLTADCTGCHGNNTASAMVLTTGKHTAHVNNTSVIGSNYGCADCHAMTVAADRTFANAALHGNSFVDYSGSRAGRSSTYTAATGVCSATYCHSDGKGSQKAMTAANWNGAALLDCAGCHGSDAAPAFTSAAGEPNYASTGANQARSNSHQKHVGSAGAATCVSCHSATVTASGTAIINGATTHTDRSIDVAQGDGKSFTWTAGAKNCSNISCHGAGSPAAVWGATMPADCTGCHGGNGASASPLATGKHAAHVSNAAVLGDNLGCVECHARTVSADRTVSSSTNHANTFADYSGTKAGGSSTYATGVCSATYCHSDGKGVQKSMAAAGWGSAATMGCTGCHGSDATPVFASQAGEPNYANAGAGLLRANSHQSHASTGAASCDTCHTATVTADGTAVRAGSLHLNRGVDVNFNVAKATAVWNGLNRTCSNISCHNGGNATWGDPTSAGCAVCHPNLSGAHTAHVSDLLGSGLVTFYNYTANRSAGTVYRYGCANCHPTDMTRHRNGQIDVSIRHNKTGGTTLASLNALATADGLNAADSGITGTSGSSVFCSAAYCHSSGKSTSQAAGDYRQSPNWYGGPYSGNKCGMCHDNPPQYAGQSHYVAASSLGNNGTPPYRDSGHMIGIHFKNTSKGNNQTGFLGYSSAGDKAHGNPALATTIGCYICHSGVVSSTKIDTYAMNGTASKFRCANCHDAGSPTPLQVGEIVNTAQHINGSKNVAFAPVSFKTKAQLSNVANALGWTRTGSYKTAGSHDSFDMSVSTWNPATKTCLTACHVNQPGIVWGASLQCVSCHANQ